jgi:hypothetical protein
VSGNVKLAAHKSKFKYLSAQHEVTGRAVNQLPIKLYKIQPNSFTSPETRFPAPSKRRPCQQGAPPHGGEQRLGIK